MKTIFILLLSFLTQFAFALNIRQLVVSPISNEAINVSLDTEAVELYYFHSWQYSISSNVITINAFYVEGFGSTMLFLNNNFEIPIDNVQNADFTIIVKIYYTNLIVEKWDLQDEMEATFSTPLSEATILAHDKLARQSNYFLYPNPTNGQLFSKQKIPQLAIYDLNGRMLLLLANPVFKIDLSHLQNGIYLAVIKNEKLPMVQKIILNK